MFDSIPDSIDEAVRCFKDQIAKQDDLRELINGAEEVDDFLGTMHFGGGRQMRNHWGLWSGMMAILDQPFREGEDVPDRVPLVDEIHEKTGLLHADDLSGFLLRHIWNEVKDTGQVDIADWLAHIRRHWMSHGKEEFAPSRQKIEEYRKAQGS